MGRPVDYERDTPATWDQTFAHVHFLWGVIGRTPTYSRAQKALFARLVEGLEERADEAGWRRMPL